MASGGMRFLPYGRQEIDNTDIQAVVEALTSDWLTTGPRVGVFEKAFAEFCGVKEAVAVNSGTAALHAAMRALGVGPGDEVIVPAITFAASANCAVYEGATPVFADIEPDTLLVDAASVASRITPRTKAIVAVDYAGQPADYDALRQVIGGRDIGLVADACHSPGATYKGRKAGTCADISCFSFHPVKHLTTCEGGMAVSDNVEYAAHMRRFRNHGIDSDAHKRETTGAFTYDMVELGYNYRIPDLLCALGMAQLSRLAQWVAKRQQIAELYHQAFANHAFARPLRVRDDRSHAYHLFVIRLDMTRLNINRAHAFAHLRSRGIGANVHYAPVYSLSFYRKRGYPQDACPAAKLAYEEILTIPMFPAMTATDVERVVAAVGELVQLG
ncbi:MAG TPA: UDP-4-amino-4,6-dideoxy-N-acetyl-beta-L-altrosamine transaminase [Rhizomicrobium sp.]|nr:UDP-4-amino-4,6-dideoxy-N-acetyl-beta-L-altrosamine transaminase [Rhizomicrobium sp.]